MELDLTGLSPDQLIELFKEVLRECNVRGDAVVMAANNALITAAEYAEARTSGNDDARKKLRAQQLKAAKDEGYRAVMNFKPSMLSSSEAAEVRAVGVALAKAELKKSELVRLEQEAYNSVIQAKPNVLTPLEMGDATKRGTDKAKEKLRDDQFKHIMREAQAIEIARDTKVKEAEDKDRKALSETVCSFYAHETRGIDLIVWSNATGTDRRVYLKHALNLSDSEMVVYYHDGNADKNPGAMDINERGKKMTFPKTSADLHAFLAEVAGKYSVLFLECIPENVPRPEPEQNRWREFHSWHPADDLRDALMDRLQSTFKAESNSWDAMQYAAKMPLPDSDTNTQDAPATYRITDFCVGMAVIGTVDYFDGILQRTRGCDITGTIYYLDLLHDLVHFKDNRQCVYVAPVSKCRPHGNQTNGNYCRSCNGIWYGASVECPHCGLDRSQPKPKIKPGSFTVCDTCGRRKSLRPQGYVCRNCDVNS